MGSEIRQDYGVKRDYRKIHIYRRLGGHRGGEYLATTTWARDLKEAREMAARKFGDAVADLTAAYGDSIELVEFMRRPRKGLKD